MASNDLESEVAFFDTGTICIVYNHGLAMADPKATTHTLPDLATEDLGLWWAEAGEGVAPIAAPREPKCECGQSTEAWVKHSDYCSLYKLQQD